MKKNYFIIAFLFSSMMFGQSSTFTNAAGGGDGKWGTSANWSAGLPGGTGTATINASVDLDVNVGTLGQITSAASAVTTSNGSKITIQTTTATISAGLLCNGANFNFNAPIEFNNGGTATNIKALQVNNATPFNARQLTLGGSSVLTLNSTMRAVATATNTKVVFNGKIEGSSNLQFAGVSEFGATADNTGFNGDFVFTPTAGASMITNSTVDGGFLKTGRKVQVNVSSCSLTLNGANSCDGNLIVGGTNTFTLNVNANQESFGNISVGGNVTINVAPTVTNLSFANTAGNIWGSGTLSITGYESGEIRFGNSNTALTAQQLSQITADGVATGQALGLDANGYLVLASTLSSDSFDSDKSKRISYPTIVNSQIYLSKPQNNVEIMDMTGKKIIKLTNQNGINSVTTSELNSGIYFIVFEGAKVEKFIKK